MNSFLLLLALNVYKTLGRGGSRHCASFLLSGQPSQPCPVVAKPSVPAITLTTLNVPFSAENIFQETKYNMRIWHNLSLQTLRHASNITLATYNLSYQLQYWALFYNVFNIMFETRCLSLSGKREGGRGKLNNVCESKNRRLVTVCPSLAKICCKPRLDKNYIIFNEAFSLNVMQQLPSFSTPISSFQ